MGDVRSQNVLVLLYIAIRLKANAVLFFAIVASDFIFVFIFSLELAIS